MNELDLSPFKVEFDRDITFNDLRQYDYIVSACKWHEQEHLYFVHSITKGYANIDKAGVKYKLWKDYIRPPHSDSSIKAIYRINKFKY